MVDFKKLKYSIDCPGCNNKMHSTMFDTAMETKLVCNNCGQTLQVHDEGGSIKNGISNLEYSQQNAEASVLGYLKSRT